MGEAYPVLREGRATAERALLAEEERFAETLDSGMKIFEDVAARVSDNIIPGVDAVSYTHLQGAQIPFRARRPGWRYPAPFYCV